MNQKGSIISRQRYCYVKIHQRGNEVIVAACDEELLGRTIYHGDLKIQISESFYKGKKIPLEYIVDYIKRGTIINLIGNNVVDEVSKSIPIISDAAIEIGGIKHVQIVTVRYDRK